MKKTKNINLKDDFNTPSKCAESPLTRWDGGIKSDISAQANLAEPSPEPDIEPDWVDTCLLNQRTKAGSIAHAPVQGGPSGHLPQAKPKGKAF